MSAEPSGTRDKRALRSSRALQDALLALLKRKPLDQITIREITAEAGIHYATFFRHHPTREALLDLIAADQIARLVALAVPVLDAADIEAAFVTLCAHVGEHRKLWTALLTGGAAGAMRAELLRVSREVAVGRATAASPVPLELAVICTVGSWWLAQPPARYTVEQMARILGCLVFSPTMRSG